VATGSPARGCTGRSLENFRAPGAKGAAKLRTILPQNQRRATLDQRGGFGFGFVSFERLPSSSVVGAVRASTEFDLNQLHIVYCVYCCPS
jgi:hypothetical protein